MTKQTNYVATVTDANSVFPPKGEAIPNSNRGLITATAGQTQGSVGAKDSWFIDTNAQPLASYPNNRLPRWQDLIPLSCDFTNSVTQIPNADSLAYNSAIRLSLCSNSGSTATLLQTIKSTTLKTFLLPYYNNDEGLYSTRVQVISLNGNNPLRMYIGSTSVSDQRCTLIFPETAGSQYYYGPSYAGYTNVVNNVFIPTAPVWPDYATDLNLVSRYYIGTYSRGGTFALTSAGSNVNTQFWGAVHNGTGSYGGYMGFSNNPYQTLFNNIPTNISANSLTDLIIQALKLVGYTF
jgi:hypothetical protein